MKGVIYARYSSDKQTEQSIEGQLRECKAYAERNGIEIIGNYIDRALSAKTDERPGFQSMIRDSAKRRFDVIIVWKLDRFSRDRYDYARYKAALKKNGVKLISATENISQGADGIILEGLLESMAEYYSADLSEKVTRGMRENALKCKYNGGNLALGYQVDREQHIVPDPISAPLIRRAFEDYAAGISLQQITKNLNAVGLCTRGGKKVDLNCTTRILHNRRYIGEYRFGEISVPNGIPAIVTQELFDRVQERMKATKKAPAKFKAEDEYYLTTKLYCGKCRCYMVGESGTSKTGAIHRYYKCVSVKKGRGCDKKSVKKDWIEDLVLKKVYEILNDEELLNDIADKALELQEKENDVLKALEKQKANVERKIGNILSAIEQGIITSSTKERLTELEQLQKDLEIQIDEESNSRPMKFTKDELMFWFSRLRRFDREKPEYKRRLIDTFVNSIYLYDDRIVMTFNYKKETATLSFADIESSELGSDIALDCAP